MKEKLKTLAKKVWSKLCDIGKKVKEVAKAAWEKAITWVLENPDKVGKFVGLCFCVWLYDRKEKAARNWYLKKELERWL